MKQASGERNAKILWYLLQLRFPTSDPSLEVEMLFWPGLSPAQCQCNCPSLMLCMPALCWMHTRLVSSETQVAHHQELMFGWGLWP